MDLKSVTEKKIAGIPAIYLILGIAVVALYGALKVKPTAKATDAATAAGDAATAAGDAPDTSQPVFQATPTITQPSGVPSSVTATPSPDTDTLWSRRAIDYLRQNGYGLDVATSAINKYLQGQPLSMTEAQARDKAVQQFGLPPENVPDTSTIPADPVPTPIDNPTTPAPAPRPAKQGSPPTTHIVRGTGDDTFIELAKLYYGSNWNNGGVNLIQAYQPQFRRNQAMPVGTHVHIPRFVEAKYYSATSATHTAIAIARKNGTTPQLIKGLNDQMSFPVRPGTRVRVR